MSKGNVAAQLWLHETLFFLSENYINMILHKICDWTTSLKPLVRFVTAYKVIYYHFTGPSWPALEYTGKQPCQIDSLQALEWLMKQNNRQLSFVEKQTEKEGDMTIEKEVTAQQSALQARGLMITKLPIGSKHVGPYLQKLFVEAQKIHMLSCALTAIPDSLCGSKSLCVLDLSFNVEIDTIEGLKECINLAYVAFRNCHRIKDITALGQCRELKHVDVQGLFNLHDVSCILDGDQHPKMKAINVAGTQIIKLNKRSEEACDHDLTSLNVMGIGHRICLDGILAPGSSLKNLNLGKHIHNVRNIFQTLHDCTPELETLTIAKVFDIMSLDIYFLAYLKRLKHFATTCGKLVKNVIEWTEGQEIDIPWIVLDLTMASGPHPANMSGALKKLRNLKVLVADDAQACPRNIDCGECFPESLEVLSLGHSINLWSVTGLKGSKIKEINFFRNPSLMDIQSLEEAQELREVHIDHDDAVNASERDTPIAETVKYLLTKTQINVHVTNSQQSSCVRCWSNRTMPILSDIPKDPFTIPKFRPTDLRLGSEF